MRRLLLLWVGFIMLQNIFSQSVPPEKTFIAPIDIQLFLSGSFAELRSNHFHSGLDIKTQGVTGKKVRSVADGYVSRIKVQTNGYGKSIYINHPGGYTSVYGHLSRYASPVDQYVKNYQYKNQIHTLDIYPGKNEIPVKQGQIIAYSGNSGSSGGPHLHFEIRETGNQHPLNGQKFGFEIKDNVDPRIYNFYIYTFSGSSNRRTVKSKKKIGLTLTGSSYHLNTGDTLFTNTPVSFGMEVFDFLNGVSNRCGIYFIKMYVDEKLFYHFQTDEFSFAETRYINAHTDYALKNNRNERVHLLFRKPNNRLSMYPKIKNDGILDFLPGEKRKLKIVISDVSGNERSVDFWVKAVYQELPEDDEQKDGQLFQWDKENDFRNELIQLNMPQGSLYEDMVFNYSRFPAENDAHPWQHVIGNESIPVHKYSTLSLKAAEIPAVLLHKACIVRYNKNGSHSYEGGKLLSNGWISANIREFGRYGIEIDTVAPSIIPANFKQNTDLSEKNMIRFVIRDDLSGIDSYEGFIDNHWVLFEYDPKNELLYYVFDPEVTEQGKKHEIEIYARDKRNNKSIFHSNFIW